MALADGLIGAWEMEEATGILTDSHGSSDLSRVGTVSQIVGLVGNAVNIEAASSSYVGGTYSALDLKNPDSTLKSWTYALWFRPNDLTTQRDIMVHGVGTLRSFLITFRPTANNVRCRIGDTDGTRYDVIPSIGAAGFDTSTWYCLFVMYDASSDTWFAQLNDLSSASKSLALPADIKDSGELYLGRHGGIAWFDGGVDQVFRWDRLLSATERGEFYNSGAGVSYADISGGSSSPVALSAVEASEARASAALLRRLFVQASARGEASATAALRALRRLAAAARAESAAQAALVAARQLSGAGASEGRASAAATLRRLLSATALGESAASATLTADAAIVLTAAAQSVSDAAATLMARRLLGAGATAEGRAAAALAIKCLLSATASGVSDASAAVLGAVATLAPPARTYHVPARSSVYRVPFQNRTYRVPANV